MALNGITSFDTNLQLYGVLKHKKLHKTLHFLHKNRETSKPCANMCFYSGVIQLENATYWKIPLYQFYIANITQLNTVLIHLLLLLAKPLQYSQTEEYHKKL